MIASTGKTSLMPRIYHRQHGLSMVELMIAMVISVVLLGGVITLFITSKRGYAVQDAVGKLQENSRIATGWLDQGLRMTDYWGGTGSSTNLSLSQKVGNTLYSSTTCLGLVADSSSGITSGFVGFAAQSSFSNLPTNVQNCIGSSANYVPNTDVLLVRYADPEPGDLVADADTTSTSSNVTVQNDTNANSVFVRYAPGFSSWIFEGNEFATAPASLAASSTNPVFNAPYIVELFFIAPCTNMADNSTCKSTDDGGSPQPALWRVALQGTTTSSTNGMVRQPLVPGVEMLRCKYGIDSTGSNNVDTFQSATGVSSWAQVYVVRYSIVVRADAPDKNQKDTTIYTLADGNSYTASTSAISPGSVPDYWYIRKVFTESIQIRNRARY
ncbi:MAG TPA: PilW family protein [Gammaproteobacteria bacterium]|nr:PilW family protein [Gammaproteobacteria bacterium]